MKSVRTSLAALSLLVISQTNAFAAGIDTSITYNSGILVLAFVCFLALMVVVQSIPPLTNIYNNHKKAAAETKRQEAKAAGIRS